VEGPPFQGESFVQAAGYCQLLQCCETAEVLKLLRGITPVGCLVQLHIINVKAWELLKLRGPATWVACAGDIRQVQVLQVDQR
jgi:hypothetical protein